MYARIMPLIAAAVFFGMAAFFVTDIQSFSFEARRLPIAIGVPFLVLSTINLIAVVRSVSRDRCSASGVAGRDAPISSRSGLDPDVGGLAGASDAALEHESAAEMTRRLTAAAVEGDSDDPNSASDVEPWAWLGVFLVSLYLLGTIIGGGAFTVLFLRLKTRVRLRVAITTALTLMLALYFFVGGFLGVRFFPGRFPLLPRL